MELFEKAKTVRLRSSHGKYLWAEDDASSVSQDRDSGEMAVWKVERVENMSVIRLKSCFDCYLTASDEAFLLGMPGKKVLQTRPSRLEALDSSIEWEPISEKSLVKLKTRHGNFLRANGGPPPWRNSVTHDVPVRTVTLGAVVLWDVEIVETTEQPIPKHLLSKPRFEVQLSFKIPKSDGRLISYAVVSDKSEPVPEGDWPSFHCKGHTIPELTESLKEELAIEDDIIVCTRHAATGKLYPLQLGLPPTNTPMHLVVVRASSSDEDKESQGA